MMARQITNLKIIQLLLADQYGPTMIYHITTNKHTNHPLASRAHETQQARALRFDPWLPAGLTKSRSEFSDVDSNQATVTACGCGILPVYVLPLLLHASLPRAQPESWIGVRIRS